MTALFHAHSGLRYLVLLAAVVALVVFAVGALRSSQPTRADRTIMAVFTGLLDLQVVVGIVLVATGVFYPALMGHIVMMVLAAAAAHGAGAAARRAEPPRNPTTIRLVGVIAALLLIVFGITAIGRSVLGAGAPSITG